MIVTKDLKELGAHTLVCSATYYDAAGERKYSPQYFKFNVANPLSVRTKVRAAPRGRAFLEVCIENSTRYALLLDSARFDTVDGIVAKDMTPEFGGEAARLDGVDDSPDAGLPSLGKRAVYRLDPSSGAAHYLFEITRANASEEPLTPQTQLGKLELRWRGAMGDPGRLQTQVIAAGGAGSTAPAPAAAKMRQSIIVHPPPPDAEDVSTVYAETPFILRAAVEALAPIRADACVVRVEDLVSGVYVDGPRAVRVGALSPWTNRRRRHSVRRARLWASKRARPSSSATPSTTPRSPRPRRWRSSPSSRPRPSSSARSSASSASPSSVAVAAAPAVAPPLDARSIDARV